MRTAAMRGFGGSTPNRAGGSSLSNGKARQGKARQGKARQGKADKLTNGHARCIYIVE
jgi:hypothetical protein